MNTKRNILLFLLLFARIICNGQGMDYDENLNILRADYGTCYTIGNYMLCPEKKIIRVGHMFGTATKDNFGYFPDSTLKYNEVTLIIFAGDVFFDNSNLNIDWKTVELLSYRDHYAEFTDGKIIYNFRRGNILSHDRKYDKDTYVANIEKRAPYRDDDELSDGFSVKKNIFYFHNIPILEPFDVPNLRTVVSKNGFETNYMTDGKRVIFGGSKGGYSSTEENGQEYVLAKQWIVDGVDLSSLRVLGRNLLIDKNALYYQGNVIPFDKLNGFKFLIREL